MTLLLTLALLLLPTLAGAQYTIPYDVPSSPGTICPNATYTGCTTGVEENDAALLAGLNNIDGDADGSVSQCDAASAVGTLCPVGQYARGITTGFAGDGCTVASGAGDMLAANYATASATVVDMSFDVSCSNCLTTTEIGSINLVSDATDQYIADRAGTEPQSGITLTPGSGASQELELLATGAGATVIQRDEDNAIWQSEHLWTPLTFWTSDASNYLGSYNETQCQYLHRQSTVQDLRAFFRDPLSALPTAPSFQLMVDDSLDMANSVDLCAAGDITAADTGDGTSCASFVDLDTECTGSGTPWTGCSGPAAGTVCENSAGTVGTEGCSTGQIPKGFWLCLQAVTAIDPVQSGVSAWLSID